VGRAVHYVSEGSPVREDGTQKYESVCRAATITQVWSDESVALAVFNPTGMFFNHVCDHDEGELADGRGAGGTWHWPERVD
jgi:hypothetical protein